MNRGGCIRSVGVGVLVLGLLSATAVQADQSRFTLARAVPGDVFLCVEGRSNPEREFLDKYWGDVLDALVQSGVGDDILAMLSGALDSGQMEELNRLRGRASELLAAVDWDDLASQELVFAERFPKPTQTARGDFHVGPPDMAFLMRGSRAGAIKNYQALLAILETGVEEINRAVGGEILVVDEAMRHGARTASLRIFTRDQGHPIIDLTLTDSGARKLEQITSTNIGHKMAIIFDGKLLCSPEIKAQIGKRAMITSDFTRAEANRIAAAINAASKGRRTGGEPLLRCCLVAEDDYAGPADEFADPEDVTGAAPKIRTLRKVLLDESAVESAEVPLPQGNTVPISLALAQRDDLVMATLGTEMLEDVLGLLDGSSSKPSIVSDPRFKSAFAKLPPARDERVFFDMQAMMGSMLGVFSKVDDAVSKERVQDVVLNATSNGPVHDLTKQAWEVYERKEYKRGLELVEQAYKLAPDDSRVLYYLACFHALLGHDDQALDLLEQAVEGGFYCPGHISWDPDLARLHDNPRFKAALDRSRQLAAERVAKDVILNSTRSGPAYDLCMKAWKVYEDENYAEGLALVEQAYQMTPDDSRVLYYLACFHALLGHHDQALDFLERAVEGGFYSPKHIAKDPDLESIRADKRYEAALASARRHAAQAYITGKSDMGLAWMRVSKRILRAVTVLDYSATVTSTEGYATRTDTITALVPDARQRPIYPLFGEAPQLTEFERYLPQETLSFSVSGGIRLDKLYEFIEDTFHVAGPKGDELLARWEEVQKELGFNIREDVLSWLSGEIVTVTLEDHRGSAWLIGVSDEAVAREKVSSAINFLSTKLTELAADNPPLAMLSVRTSPTLDERLAGFENLHFMVSPQPIVWGVADDHLIFGSSAEAVALCLETARGTHPGIRQNERVMREALLPTGPFSSVSLSDQRGLGDELAMIAGIVSTAAGMMSGFIDDPDVRPILGRVSGITAKLTPVLRKIDFYKSTAGYTDFDGSVWHTRMVTNYATPEERAAPQQP